MSIGLWNIVISSSFFLSSAFFFGKQTHSWNLIVFNYIEQKSSTKTLKRITSFMKFKTILVVRDII